MRILIVSDVWKPTVNGLVTVLAQLTRRLRQQGHQVHILHPGMYARVRCPWYPDVNLALNLWRTGELISAWRPNYIHIASEGPCGLAARKWALAQGLPITTAIHTRMDIHLNTNLGFPISWVEAYMRWFHSGSSSALVHTTKQKADLERDGYRNLTLWRQGIDLSLFRPLPDGEEPDDYLLFVGRISAEKDIEHFLELPSKLRKVVVGTGPRLRHLKQRYPDAEFTGLLRGEQLAEVYRRARALVMPSRSETLGIVMLEAMASGVPVAAYPVTGPLGTVENGVNGWLDDDLSLATEKALEVDRAGCRRCVADRDWERTVSDFLGSLKTPPAIRWDGYGKELQPSLQS